MKETTSIPPDLTGELPTSGQACISASIRNAPEDFIVEEIPSIQPEGEGEHLWLLIEKRVENTADIAQQLGRLNKIPPKAVGYAGRKDRHAVARQWFSLHLPGRQDPEPELFSEQGITVLKAIRHTRKLKIGALAGNQFRIRLRGVSGDTQAVEERLAFITHYGVPNYFGEQRFGHAGNNLARARAMFAGRPERDRNRRSLYLSAARSALFNAILSRRVSEASWNQLLQGECVVLDGSRSHFVADESDPILLSRLEAWDIHPSGPLWGTGSPPSTGVAGRLEQEVADSFTDITDGLMNAGLRQERRSLRLRPSALSWDWENEKQELVLDFSLPAGTFATAVLREIARYTDSASPRS